MMITLQTRHWVMIIASVILSAVAFFAVRQMIPHYAATIYAFPVFALAVILDTLGEATERHRTPLKLLGWVCLIMAAFVALSPLTGAFSGMLATSQAWRDAGWALPRAALEGLKFLGQYSADQKLAMILAAAVGMLCLTLAVLVPCAAFSSKRIGTDRKASAGPWQAAWMDSRDIAHLAGNKTGLPLALHQRRLLRYVKNDVKGWRGGHHLVVSGTRGGKGVSAVIPAILDHQGPVVVLDIKGENFAITRRHRQELGRKVAVLNPFGVVEASSDQFNPLDYIQRDHLDRGAVLVADGLVKPESGDGAHFSEMARQLIKAAIEVIVTQEEPQRRNLVAVADLLLSADLDATLQAWVENADIVGHSPAKTAATILQAGDRERGSIQTSVAKALDWMQSDSMRGFLERSSFSLDDLLDDQLDLFIVVPLDQVDRQAVFMRLFINLVLGTVVRQDGHRKVKAPILLVLDEFVRMGRMEQIMNIANVAAGAGIEALFVTQDTGQVETAYGKNDARSIFGSCITKRIFNLNDIETAEWTARHMGEGTIYSQQIREGKVGSDGPDLSYAEQRQQLMTPQQIMAMAPDELLLLVGNRAPLRAKQNLYFKSKGYRGRYDPNPLN